MTVMFGADVSALVTEDQWASLRCLDAPVKMATARCYEQRGEGLIAPNCIESLKNAKAAGIEP